MIDRLLAKVFGTQHERDIKKLLPRVRRINELEPAMKGLSDAELRAKTDQFRTRIADTRAKGPEDEKERRPRGRRSWTRSWRRPSPWCGRPPCGRSGCVL